MKQYKVIKEFGCANKGDIFYEDEESFVLRVESTCDDVYSSRYMSISPSVLDTLVNGEYLVELEEETSDKDSEKIDRVKDLINTLLEQYTADHEALTKEYSEGNVPACIKTEADTVYFNLNKVLNKILEVVNE